MSEYIETKLNLRWKWKKWKKGDYIDIFRFSLKLNVKKDEKMKNREGGQIMSEYIETKVNLR